MPKRAVKESPEDEMRGRLKLHHKQAVRELEKLKRVEDYRSMYVRIMMATSPTLIEKASLQELERIFDFMHDCYDSLDEAA